MRWLARRYKAYVLELQAGQRFLRQAQVTKVNRVEGTTENPDWFQNRVSHSNPHMAVTQHDVFLRSQTFQAHRSAGVDFIGGNPDLRPQAVFETIGKAR